MATVNITCSTPDASIYYSTDDSIPSILYSSEFEVNEVCNIQTVAKKDGYLDSDISNQRMWNVHLNGSGAAWVCLSDIDGTEITNSQGGAVDVILPEGKQYYTHGGTRRQGLTTSVKITNEIEEEITPDKVEIDPDSAYYNRIVYFTVNQNLNLSFIELSNG